MSTHFDDLQVRSAMAAFLSAADALDEQSRLGAEPRRLLDLAESKAVAGLALRKRLGELGWAAPARQRSST